MSTVNPIETLQGIRDLLADPARWTRGNFAVNGDGRPCEPEDESAVSWCLFGGTAKVAPDHAAAVEATNFICDRLPEDRRLISKFNDDLRTTHADVLALLDRCISEAQCNTSSPTPAQPGSTV